jgi:hypothetical protein
LTLAPGVAIPETTVRGPVVVRVEIGTLTVQVDGPATITVGLDATSTPRAIDVGIAQPVHVGEVLTITAGTRYTAWNAGGAPAGVLAAAIVPAYGSTGDRPFGAALIPSDAAVVTGPPDASTGLVPAVATPAREPIVWPPGVEGRYLVCLRLPALPAEGPVMTAGLVILVPGASFRPLAVDGTALLAVESGSLALSVGRGRVQLVNSAGEEAAVADAFATGENPLGVGDAALVLPRTIAFARNGGDAPLAVVVVTITQVVAS